MIVAFMYSEGKMVYFFMKHVERHFTLLKNVIIKSIEYKDGLMIARSYLNDNWYDAVTPIETVASLDLYKVENVIRSLQDEKLHFSFYVESAQEQYVRDNFTFLDVNNYDSGDAHLVKNISDENIDNYPLPRSDIEIRSVTPDLFETYQSLVSQVHGNEEGWAAAPRFAELIFKAQEDSDIEQIVKAYVAFYQGEPAGYAAGIYSKEMDIAYQANSGVLQDFRRKGIYKALVNYRVKKAIELGISNIYVVTGQESNSWHAAIKNGYAEVARYEYFQVK